MRWPKIPSIITNKYFLALVVILVWVMFFDKHNLVRQWRMQRQVRELKEERAFYLEEIERDSLAIHRLRNDPDALERYAREKYLMKREGEEIFIIVEE